MEKTSTSTHIRFYCYFCLSGSSCVETYIMEFTQSKRGNKQLIDWELSFSFLLFTQPSLSSVKQLFYLRNQWQTVILLLSASQTQRLTCWSTITDRNTLFFLCNPSLCRRQKIIRLSVSWFSLACYLQCKSYLLLTVRQLFVPSFSVCAKIS